jgi:hypothetical protein
MMKRYAMMLVLLLAIWLATAAPMLAQANKPTPTPLPPGTPVFEIPDNYSLWASTDYAIQSWNLLAARTIIQAIVMVVLIGGGLFILTKFIRDITEQDSQD